LLTLSSKAIEMCNVSTTYSKFPLIKVYEASLEVLLSKDTGQISAGIKNANVPLWEEST